MNKSLRIAWMETSRTFPYAEKMSEPSMTEPSPSISLEQMVRDYSRGVIHTSRVGYYDNGEEVPEDFHEPEDISEVHEYEASLRSRRRKPAPPKPPVEPPAPEPEPKPQEPPKPAEPAK